MDFDTAKENIQPLRQGRRADRLEAAFGEQSKESLDIEKREYEEAIANYEGHDPLSLWYEYICWIEQSFPTSGSESGLDEAVLKCIVKFEDDSKYRQDRRMIKLFIKYIDAQQDPQEMYSQLYSNGIGTMVADLYIAWSYYFDALNNFKQVEAIFRKGFDAGAQPIEELSQAHQAFSISMSRRLLYDDEDSKKQFKVSMEEKRSALTSLRAHKKKHVGSLRTGIAVRHENPGVVPQEPAQSLGARKFEIHEQDGEHGASALPSNTSVIRSIIDGAKKKENLHEPGPWTKAKSGKSGGIFGKSGATAQLDFNIMEDDNLPPIPCPEKLYEKGIQLPHGWICRNKPQHPFDVPIVIDEPVAPRTIPCYEKFFLYPNAKTEISSEEYRGYLWFKKHDITAPITQMYEHIWSNQFETGTRIPPGFVTKNVPQNEKEEFERYTPSDDHEHIEVPFTKMFPKDCEEKSNEELLGEKFRAGKIQLMTEQDFEEFDDMEETIIGDRRHSIYRASRMSFVPRKSIMPRKSILPPPVAIEEEDETIDLSPIKHQQVVPQSLGAIRKSIIKRKIDEKAELNPESDNMQPLSKKENVSETPPRSSFSNNFVKPFQPPEKKTVQMLVIEDDDQNDTCSTQQFNFFIKAQSVSTPVSKKISAKAAQEVQFALKEIEDSASSSTVLAQTNGTPPDNAAPKQLSTIMETTETTHSTKSSVNETDFNPKTPKHMKNSNYQQILQPKFEEPIFNPLIASFRMPEEQTETCTNMALPIRMNMNEINNTTQFKMMTPAKSFMVSAPKTPAQVDYDLEVSSPPFIISIQSSGCESSKKAHDAEVTQIEVPDIHPEKENFAILSTVKDVTSSPFIISIKSSDTEESPINHRVTASHASAPQMKKDSFDIPDSQPDVSQIDILTSDDFNVPSTQVESQELIVTEPEFQIPETQPDLDILSTQPSIEDPACKTEWEIPATQLDVSVARPTQEIVIPKINVTEVEKKAESCPFQIYEDSLMEQPATKAENSFNGPEKHGFSNISCKENIIAPHPARSASDEFLELLASPVKKTSCKMSIKETSKSGNQGEISDLLKFSGVAAMLETSLKQLTIDREKCATPTQTFPNFFEDDLNTEKFGLSLGHLKNSTLLVDSKPKCNQDFDLSVVIDADELERLGMSSKLTQSSEPEFKVPLPVPVQKLAPKLAATSFKIYEDNEEEADESDLSKTIYKPKEQFELEIDDQDWSGEEMCSFVETPVNKYEHSIIEDDDSMQVQEGIKNANGDPFDDCVRALMLQDCNFSKYLEDHVPTCKLLKKIPPLRPGLTLECGADEFKILKFLTKGSFGSIFTARSASNGHIYAMKQEKPPNLWEYYICIEVVDRLKDKRMMPGFMNIEHAIVANNSSVLITQFSPYGSIIDVCNKYKNVTNKNVDEYVVMVLTTQMLSIIDHLHAAKIIHADIKPDNFLLMSRIENGSKSPALQLIDFGNAIDMDWYKRGETFTTTVSTENFICCEMKEGKPWTYQTDLFGVAGTSHVMLFGKYMEVEKKMSWNIKSRFPRYFNKCLWDQFFNSLLNIQNCDTMPNLQAIKDEFEEVIQSKRKFVGEKVEEFNKIIVDSI